MKRKERKERKEEKLIRQKGARSVSKGGRGGRGGAEKNEGSSLMTLVSMQSGKINECLFPLLNDHLSSQRGRMSGDKERASRPPLDEPLILTEITG